MSNIFQCKINISQRFNGILIWVLKYLISGYLYAYLSLLGFEISDVGIFKYSLIIIGF